MYTLEVVNSVANFIRYIAYEESQSNRDVISVICSLFPKAVF